METEKNCGNIIFLDFDGVCNSFERGSYLTHEPKDYGADMRIIERVGEICKKCSANIVVSSNWRRYGPDDVFVYRDMDYKNPLENIYKNLGGFVLGTLPKDHHLTKSQALDLWFEDNPWFNGRYVIVDDDPREGFQFNLKYRKNFWLTDRKYGLTENSKNEIIKHLKGN